MIVAGGFIAGLCGRSDGWSSCRSFSRESCPTPVALDVALKNGRLLNEAIDGGLCQATEQRGGHRGVAEDAGPFAVERQVDPD